MRPMPAFESRKCLIEAWRRPAKNLEPSLCSGTTLRLVSTAWKMQTAPCGDFSVQQVAAVG